MANTAARIGTVNGWNERIERVRAEGLNNIADEAMARWFTAMFRASSPSRVTEMRTVLTTTATAGYAGACAALRDSDLTSLLHLIQKPALVVSGAEDPVTTIGDGHKLASMIPHARCVELEAAHISAIEQPRQFADAVLAFLNSAEVRHG